MVSFGIKRNPLILVLVLLHSRITKFTKIILQTSHFIVFKIVHRTLFQILYSALQFFILIRKPQNPRKTQLNDKTERKQ